MDAKAKADKYVERGGYIRGERRSGVPDDLLAAASFIAWHDDNRMHGGVTAKDAFQSFCRLLNFDPIQLRKIVRGQE